MPKAGMCHHFADTIGQIIHAVVEEKGLPNPYMTDGLTVLKESE